MPSQFFGLTIAGSGLRNSNAALNTTANNISNVQTEGYSRQTVNSQAADALRTFTTYGCAGAVVETLSIERARDDFYDVKYRNNNANYGQFEIKSYYTKTLEEYLDDDGSTGFVTVFNKLSGTLQSLADNPSSTSTKAQFVAGAEALTDYFNNLYGNLQELQKDINLELKQCVDEINSIAEQIATLNKQINVIELSGSKANDLRDQRDVLYDKLSEYVDVDIKETPIYDTNDPTRETGGTRAVVKIAGGQILVDANDYSTLECVAREDYEKINQTDVQGLYKVKWDNGNEFNLNNASLNGKLKGLVELRDGNNGSNFSGKVIGVATKAETGEQMVTISADSDYMKSVIGLNLPETSGNYPTGSITIGNASYVYNNWLINYKSDSTQPDGIAKDEQGFGIIESYTLTIDKTKSESSKLITTGSTASTQDAIKYQGIPYYMTQMNSFLRSFLGKMNSIFENGYDINNNLGVNVFTADHITDDKQYSQADLENGGKEGYYFMTCGNVSINKDLIYNADLLGTRADVTHGVEECDQVKEAISALSTKSVYSFRNASANQMLELILSDVALNASNASTYEKTYEGLNTSIDNQRTSISGVDEDEEAVNLVKYQNAYTLASKMVQTLTEIYDRLILNTGV